MDPSFVLVDLIKAQVPETVASGVHGTSRIKH